MASPLPQTLDGKMVLSLAASGFTFIQIVENTLNKCTSREFSSCPSDCQRLLVFDGPLDMDWVENFNTLLDENQVPIIITSFAYSLPTNLLQVLCFESGECQALSSGVRVVFEATSLANISPATVSRCAVVSLLGTLCREYLSMP